MTLPRSAFLCKIALCLNGNNYENLHIDHRGWSEKMSPLREPQIKKIVTLKS